MKNNDLNQIRIFSKVAQLQSFTKAAESLELEKSTVSTKISQLETRLGIRLLQRTTRSVSLTEAGSEYLSYCEQALTALQMGDDFISGLSQTPTGHLRVSVPQNMVEFIMCTVITPFLQRYPKINLEMVESNQRVNLIKDNYDIAIRSSAQDIQDSSLIYRKIHHSEWVLAASPRHIETFGLATNPQELTTQPSIGIVNENANTQHKDHFYWQSQKVILKHRFAINNMINVIQAVKNGLGYAMIPKNMIKEELAQQQLIEISSDVDIKPTTLYLVYPSRSGQPAKLKAFIDAMLQWAKC